MKLNYKRTILVGFAFFLISAFWQAYDNTIPLILTNKFGMSQAWSGIIMAADNILALFLLPLFGALSDKCNGKRGRRTPFIVVGTVIAAVALIALSFVDGAQLRNIEKVSAIDDPVALEVIYDSQKDATLLSPNGERFVLSEKFDREEFTAIRTTTVDKNGKQVTNSDYTSYVVPARQAYAWQTTAASPSTLIFFVLLLLVVLVSMALFRSPAVALMPDVTIKPLRSKANAIINLMGSAGGILVLVLGMVFATASVRNSLMSYTAYFSVIAAIMLTALIIFLLTVQEKEWAAQMQADSIRLGIEEQKTEDAPVEERKLTAEEKRSLIFILLSIVLWFFGYNAVTSKYSVYASNILHKDYNLTLIIAQAAAIVSYLPVGMIASKVGRKKTILAGVVMLATAFAAAAFVRANSPNVVMIALFALAGIAWATINVNSFPMVVELCSGGNVGKYTGFYYTASMAAQVATPMISGILMDKLGMTVLFPYAAVFVALAFVTMRQVRHGDSKPEAKKGLDALDNAED
ncbi:MAG: MFS transporter [Oscillospiraceae bacterium]|nr:MFS transporter [Oscillospiraceae bacterium]